MSRSREQVSRSRIYSRTQLTMEAVMLQAVDEVDAAFARPGTRDTAKAQ